MCIFYSCGLEVPAEQVNQSYSLQSESPLCIVSLVFGRCVRLRRRYRRSGTLWRSDGYLRCTTLKEIWRYFWLRSHYETGSRSAVITLLQPEIACDKIRDDRLTARDNDVLFSCNDFTDVSGYDPVLTVLTPWRSHGVARCELVKIAALNRPSASP